MSAQITLSDEQLHTLAALIADELQTRQQSAGPLSQKDHLVDAGELAERLGTSRRWIYEHADELGAVRLGDGAKPRLRFDVDTARAAMARSTGGRSHAVNADEHGRSEVSTPRRRRRLPNGLPQSGRVLAVRPAITTASRHSRAQARNEEV